MKCPSCGKSDAFWLHGLGSRALYRCETCKREFYVNLEQWDRDERDSRGNKRGEDYIIKK